MACSECGFDWCSGVKSEDAEHRKFHDDYLLGLPAERLSNGLHFISKSSPRCMWHLAKAAEAMGRRYSDPPFESAFFDEEDPPIGIAIALLIRDQRIAGGIIANRRLCSHLCELESFRANPIDPKLFRPSGCGRVNEEPRRTVEYLWAAARKRGQGFPESMLGALEQHFGTVRNEFAFSVPFTAEGLRFCRRIGMLKLFCVSPSDAIV